MQRRGNRLVTGFQVKKKGGTGRPPPPKSWVAGSGDVHQILKLHRRGFLIDLFDRRELTR